MKLSKLWEIISSDFTWNIADIVDKRKINYLFVTNEKVNKKNCNRKFWVSQDSWLKNLEFRLSTLETLVKPVPWTWSFNWAAAWIFCLLNTNIISSIFTVKYFFFFNWERLLFWWSNIKVYKMIKFTQGKKKI